MMKKLLTVAIVSLLMLPAVSGYSQNRTPNKMERIAKKYPARKIEKVHTVNLANTPEEDFYAIMRNTRVVQAPGLDIEKDIYKAEKARLNAEKAARRAAEQNNPVKVAPKSNKVQVNEPIVGSSFFANTMDGIPNDNALAVGVNGKLVSAINSSIRVYHSSGASLQTRTLASFLSTTAIKYDPRVIYDPDFDRFILVYLVGDNANQSKVVVCFSENGDPTGNWSIYTLNGNADPGSYGNCWTDYPQVALTKDELFITGNLFTTGSNLYQAGYIWQLDKEDGYNGASTIDVQEWSGAGSNFFSPTPVTGQTGLLGPEMWFLVTRNAGSGPSNSVRLHRVTDNQDNSPQFESFSLFASPTYALSSDADQMGTSRQLDVRGNRVRTAYIENNRIHFATNGSPDGGTDIYYATIQGLDNPFFAAVNGNWLQYDSLEIGYPSLAYGGRVAKSTGDNASVLFFNFSSANHFPGNAVVYVDTNGVVSDPVMLTYGFNYIQQMQSGPERWGDYSTASVNYNNPGEVWVTGYIGYSSFRHGTWISQLFVNGSVAVGSQAASGITEKPELTVAPNPVSESTRINFEVPQAGNYSAKVYDATGRLIDTLADGYLHQGEAAIAFTTKYLKSGIYFLVITKDGEDFLREKLVVQN